MGWALLGSNSENTTKNYNTTIESGSESKGTGLGTFQGSENVRQQTGSANAVVGNANRRQSVTGYGTFGNKNRRQTSTGFSNAGTNTGRGVQTIARGNALQGADMSRANAAGDISHLGDHSSIGGDFYNRDFDLELNAAPGATINYEVGDSGVSEAITDLGRALGRTSYGGVEALDNAVSGQQKVEISKQILYAIIAGFVGIIVLRK